MGGGIRETKKNKKKIKIRRGGETGKKVGGGVRAQNHKQGEKRCGTKQRKRGSYQSRKKKQQK
jgi:hypothetical protein